VASAMVGATIEGPAVCVAAVVGSAGAEVGLEGAKGEGVGG